MLQVSAPDALDQCHVLERVAAAGDRLAVSCDVGDERLGLAAERPAPGRRRTNGFVAVAAIELDARRRALRSRGGAARAAGVPARRRSRCPPAARGTEHLDVDVHDLAREEITPKWQAIALRKVARREMERREIRRQGAHCLRLSLRTERHVFSRPCGHRMIVGGISLQSKPAFAPVQAVGRCNG